MQKCKLTTKASKEALRKQERNGEVNKRRFLQSESESFESIQSVESEDNMQL